MCNASATNPAHRAVPHRLIVVLPVTLGWAILPAALPTGTVMAASPSASSFFADATTAKLTAAAGRSDDAGVRQLIAAGADPNTVGAEGMTPLLYAIVGKSKAGAKALLEAGADPNHRARDGETALTMVASGNDTE